MAAIKLAIIWALTATNIMSNSLVISVLLRFPQLREDRNALFILSMSCSDLGSGLFNILLSAGLCFTASPFLLREYPYLATIVGFAMWWFTCVSMYSLCWLILSKNVAIAMPFRSDELLSRKRCHIINGLTWLVGFCLSAVLLSEDLTWGEGICSFDFPTDSAYNLYYTLISLITLFLPRVLLTWGTVRIMIIVMRTHRQISAQEFSVVDEEAATTISGTLTAKTLRSSINIIVICLVSIILSTPVAKYIFHLNITAYQLPSLYGFVCIWMFQLNTVANGVLYLILFRSVRKRTSAMLQGALKCIWE